MLARFFAVFLLSTALAIPASADSPRPRSARRNACLERFRARSHGDRLRRLVVRPLPKGLAAPTDLRRVETRSAGTGGERR